MAGSFLKENHKYITIFLCILSIALIFSSQLFAIFTLDADKRIGGLADINLKADFYQARVDFTATAKVETGGLGGLIGGIVDLGGVTGDGNITISDDVYYYEGMERLQGVVGVLYDTTKNADYTVNPQTWNSTNTKVYVNTHTDLIPFWPEGLGQEISITVRLNQTDNLKSLRINKVWIDIYTDWNETARKYRKKAEEAWSTRPNDILYKSGDERVYKHPITIQKDWGERIGIIAKVDLTLTDNLDQTQYTVVEPFTQDSHPQKIINVRPIGQGEFVSILLMFLSLPISVLAAIFAGIGIILAFLGKRRAKHVLFTAAMLEIFAIIFFVNGANTLLGLIEFLTEDDYYWNAVGVVIPIVAGALLFVAFLLETLFGPRKEEKGEKDEIKFDISAAMVKEGEPRDDEEEEEMEDEGFECPVCGTEFSEMVHSCPNCHAEFEGVDEDEEEEGREEDHEEVAEKEGAKEVEEKKKPEGISKGKAQKKPNRGVKPEGDGGTKGKDKAASEKKVKKPSQGGKNTK